MLHTDHPAWTDVAIGRLTGANCVHRMLRRWDYSMGKRISAHFSTSCAGTFEPWTYGFAHFPHAASDLRVSTAILQPNERNRKHLHVPITISSPPFRCTHFQSRQQDGMHRRMRLRNPGRLLNNRLQPHR